MQPYASLTGDLLARELLHEIAGALAHDADEVAGKFSLQLDSGPLRDVSNDIASGKIDVSVAPVRIHRELAKLTRQTSSPAFVFLDDAHLLDHQSQPDVFHIVHGALKGANGWLKISGLKSLLNQYSLKTRRGLQSPGDAQQISLDLTLENPEAAESHLRAILENFLQAVGYSLTSTILPEDAFQRLVWANAGVPRDFLQMFGRALELAGRSKHAAVTVTDVNVAIGEAGQRKQDDMDQDAKNESGALRRMLDALEAYCLDERRVNAFLVKGEESEERRLVHTLSDLRLVHLIHQSTTPDKAGVRYEGYILDYSLFTGFRRRQNIDEMVPEEGQFKAKELRKLPKIAAGFLAQRSKKDFAAKRGGAK